MVLTWRKIRIGEGVKRDGIMIYGHFCMLQHLVMIQARAYDMIGSRGHPGRCKSKAKLVKIYGAE